MNYQLSTMFLSNGNIQMLWELITTHSIYLQLTELERINLQNRFSNSMREFFQSRQYHSTMKTMSIVDLNKYFISDILNHLHNHVKSRQPPKIAISNVPANDAIQPIEYNNNTNVSNNDNYFSSFDDPKPNPINFATKADEPIKNMEELLSTMQKQRNYDIDISPPSNDAIEKLKPIETSRKGTTLKGTTYKETTRIGTTQEPPLKKHVTMSNDTTIIPSNSVNVSNSNNNTEIVNMIQSFFDEITNRFNNIDNQLLNISQRLDTFIKDNNTDIIDNNNGTGTY